MRKIKHWKSEELYNLMQDYSKTRNKNKLAKIYGVSVGAIYKKIYHLRSKGELIKTLQERDWTSKEIQSLKDNWITESAENIQKKLPHRSWISIIQKARTLKIGKRMIKGFAQFRYKSNQGLVFAGTTQKDGYILINNDGKWITAHRYEMEQKIGRKLKSSELVHHLDGNKQNNKISNLQIVSKTSHKHFDTERACELEQYIKEKGLDSDFIFWKEKKKNYDVYEPCVHPQDEEYGIHLHLLPQEVREGLI